MKLTRKKSIEKKIDKISKTEDIMNFCKPCTWLFCFTNIELCKDPEIKNLLSKQFLKLYNFTSDHKKYNDKYQNILKEIMLYSDIDNVTINANMNLLLNTQIIP